MIQTHQIKPPPPIPQGMDVRLLRPWLDGVQQSVRSCIDAIRAIEYKPMSHTPRDWLASSTVYPIYPYLRHGFTISGVTITLLSGKLKFHGSKVCTTAQKNFTLGGTQYFYVHHVRGSSACEWLSAGAEPGSTSTTDLDWFFYKFIGVNLQADSIGHLGDINLDLPLG